MWKLNLTKVICAFALLMPLFLIPTSANAYTRNYAGYNASAPMIAPTYVRYCKCIKKVWVPGHRYRGRWVKGHYKKVHTNCCRKKYRRSYRY